MTGISDAMPVEHQIVAAIRQIVRAVDLQSRRLVESHNLTGPQLATLQEIARLQPASPSAIARAVHLSPGTVTGILQRLERRDLASRRPSETDRRAVLIEVSAAGQALLDAAPSLLQDRFKQELERLEEWERSMILATLQRVARLMGAEQIEAVPHLLIEAMGDGAVSDPAPGDETPAG